MAAQFSSATDDEDTHIASINIIPLVDVVLVLLIIFMVTAVFTKESAMKLNLPTTRFEHPTVPPMEVTVNVDKNQRITVNGKPTRIEDLQATLKSYGNADPRRKTLVVLRGDKQALYGAIVPVLDNISQAGMEVTIALTRERPT